MTEPAAPTADRTPLATAVVLEAVQRIEAAGPLDDQAALQQAFRTRPTRAAQVAERGWLLGQRLGLPAELARWRHLGWWVVAALAVAMAFTGLGTARFDGAEIGMPPSYDEVYHDGVAKGDPNLSSAETGAALSETLTDIVARFAVHFASRVPA